MATISEELTKLESTKADIKSALVEKGLNPTDVFSSYALNIRDIQSGGDLDFSKIGYNYTPQFITDGLKYGELAYNSVNPDAVNYDLLFGGNTTTLCNELIFFPKITMPAALMNGRLLDRFPFLKKVQIFPDIKVEVLNLPYSCFGPDLKSFHLDGQLFTYSGRVFLDCSSLNDIIITGGLHPDSLNDRMFMRCTSLREFNVAFTTLYSSMFANMSLDDYYGNILLIIPSNTVKVSSTGSGIFGGTNVAMNISIDASDCLYPSSLFNAKYLYKCPEIILPNIQNSSISLYSMLGLYVYQVTIKNLGSHQNNTTILATVLKVIDSVYTWSSGISITPEENRQSLIDSLITYSFDRATAGYPTCTIKLAADTKALLTEEEIAQITAKGFTIA